VSSITRTLAPSKSVTGTTLLAGASPRLRPSGPDEAVNGLRTCGVAFSEAKIYCSRRNALHVLASVMSLIPQSGAFQNVLTATNKAISGNVRWGHTLLEG
jgi:hypothetical protein